MPARGGGAGRPRDPELDEAILSSVIDVIAEDGLGALTIEGVAERAGVGKTTVYRRWPSKTELVRDALNRFSEEEPWASVEDQGDARSELVEVLRRYVGSISRSRLRDVIPTLIAEGARDEELATSVRADIERRRRGVKEILRRGIDRGEIRSDIDADLAIDFLLGAVQYRLLITGRGLMTGPTIEKAVDQLLDGARAKHEVTT